MESYHLFFLIPHMLYSCKRKQWNTSRARYGGGFLLVRGQPGLRVNSRPSQVYVVRSCLKRKRGKGESFHIESLVKWRILHPL